MFLDFSVQGWTVHKFRYLGSSSHTAYSLTGQFGRHPMQSSSRTRPPPRIEPSVLPRTKLESGIGFEKSPYRSLSQPEIEYGIACYRSLSPPHYGLLSNCQEDGNNCPKL